MGIRPDPTFSILMPAYQSGTTIGRAIRSVLAQSRDDWELLIVDDGSADDSYERALEVAAGDPRVTVIRQTNSGPAGARNTGLERARGEYICLLDADDEYTPEYLERMGRSIAEEPRATLYSCNAIIVDQRGVRTRWLDSAEFEHPLSLGLLRLIRHNAIFVQCAVRATAMREVGGFDARLRACEDYDLWLRLLAAGHRHLYTPECLGLYHRTPTSLSSHYQREAQHVALVLQSLIDTGTLSTAEERAARMRIRAALARMELERRRAENDLRISRRDALATAAAYGTPTRRAVARVLALVSPGTYLKIAFRRRGEQVDALYEGTRDVDERTSDQAL